MAEKKSEKHEVKELIFLLHEQHRDITEPFARRLVDLYHAGDGDGFFYLCRVCRLFL
jgi:hypothetical protein